MAAIEGEYPKAFEDIQYSSEANKFHDDTTTNNAKITYDAQAAVAANTAKISYDDEAAVTSNTAFRTTPSTAITAGTNISWTGNTLNATAGSAIGIVPIGGITGWLKSFTNTPALDENFVECNGQTLDDDDSVYDDQTIPDLNGDNRFLRGNSTSGTTGGTTTHTHSTTTVLMKDGILDNVTPLATIAAGDNIPPYYNIVWVMRIK